MGLGLLLSVKGWSSMLVKGSLNVGVWTNVWMNGHLLSKNQSKMRGWQAWITLEMKRHKGLLQTSSEDNGVLWFPHYFSRVENLESFHKAFLLLLHII